MFFSLHACPYPPFFQPMSWGEFSVCWYIQNAHPALPAVVVAFREQLIHTALPAMHSEWVQQVRSKGSSGLCMDLSAVPSFGSEAGHCYCSTKSAQRQSSVALWPDPQHYRVINVTEAWTHISFTTIIHLSRGSDLSARARMTVHMVYLCPVIQGSGCHIWNPDLSICIQLPNPMYFTGTAVEICQILVQ